MKTRLTLQEKLRDLRGEKKLTLAEVAEATGIPLSTLQRMEGNEDMRIGYQDVAMLSDYYNVSTDYLFGLTDNRQHRNIEVDKLRLSDAAISVLESGKTNNRLISEFLSHSDFPQLLSAMEIYIDRKVLPQMNTMNAMYQFAESTIKENFDVADDDETISFFQQMVVDEDEYLRYRISERFNGIMKSLFDAHKKDALSDEQTDIIKEMKDGVQDYLSNKDSGRGTVILLAKQLGLNLSQCSDEEILLLTRVLQRSDKYKHHKGLRPKKRK